MGEKLARSTFLKCPEVSSSPDDLRGAFIVEQGCGRIADAYPASFAVDGAPVVGVEQEEGFVTTKAMSNGPSDRELLERAARKDRDAYQSLVERYQSRAYSIAFEIVRSKEDAEDIVQESFVKAYLSLPDFRGQSSFYTWFYRIVYNLAIDFRRKIARQGGGAVEFDEALHQRFADGASLRGHVEGPQETLLRKEQAKRIKVMLKDISEDHRMVILLREVDGMSYEEIADVLGISKGTVMSRLHYARKKLQRGLADLVDEGLASRSSGQEEKLLEEEAQDEGLPEIVRNS